MAPMWDSLNFSGNNKSLLFTIKFSAELSYDILVLHHQGQSYSAHCPIVSEHVAYDCLLFCGSGSSFN